MVMAISLLYPRSIGVAANYVFFSPKSSHRKCIVKSFRKGCFFLEFHEKILSIAVLSFRKYFPGRERGYEWDFNSEIYCVGLQSKDGKKNLTHLLLLHNTVCGQKEMCGNHSEIIAVQCNWQTNRGGGSVTSTIKDLFVLLSFSPRLIHC